MHNLHRYLSALLLVLLQIPAYAQVEFLNLTIDEALLQAQDQQKMILVDIYTVWCVPCKELDKHIFQDDTVGAFINQRFVSIRINAEDSAGLVFSKRFEIPEAYPTVLLLDETGVEIDRIIGLFGKEEYVHTLQDYAQHRNTFREILAAFPDSDRDSNMANQLGQKFKARAKYEEALRYFQIALEDSDMQADHLLWFNVSAVQYRLAHKAEVLAAIHQALKLDPGNDRYERFLSYIKSN